MACFKKGRRYVERCHLPVAKDAVLKKKAQALRRWCCSICFDVGVGNLLGEAFPQKPRFQSCCDDADEEGLSEMAQRVSMMLRRCLSVRVFLLIGVPTFCCCSCWKLVEHGLLDVLIGIR